MERKLTPTNDLTAMVADDRAVCQIDLTKFGKLILTATRAVATHSNHPICKHLLVERNGKLKLSANNLEFSFEIWFQVSGNGSGEVAVPGEMFAKIVAKLGEQQACFQIDPQDLFAYICCGYGSGEVSFRLRCLSSQEFPHPINLEADRLSSKFDCDWSEFQKALRATAWATSKRAAGGLENVRLKVEKDKDRLIVCATNRAVLAVVELPIVKTSGSDVETDILLQERSTSFLCGAYVGEGQKRLQIATERDAFVEISCGDSTEGFRFAGRCFPGVHHADVLKLLLPPERFPVVLEVNARSLFLAIERSKVLLEAHRIGTKNAIDFKIASGVDRLAVECEFSQESIDAKVIKSPSQVEVTVWANLASKALAAFSSFKIDRILLCLNQGFICMKGQNGGVTVTQIVGLACRESSQPFRSSDSITPQ